jgi:hypothetical protein
MLDVFLMLSSKKDKRLKTLKSSKKISNSQLCEEDGFHYPVRRYRITFISQ